MMRRTLWNDFFLNRDWPTASAAAMVLLILLVGPLLVYERVQLREERQTRVESRREHRANRRAGRRIRVPLRADPAARHLQLQRVAIGDRVGRRLDALVRRASARCANSSPVSA